MEVRHEKYIINYLASNNNANCTKQISFGTQSIWTSEISQTNNQKYIRNAHIRKYCAQGGTI